MEEKDTRLRKKRLQELADQSYQTNSYYFTDFLAPADAAMAYEVCQGQWFSAWGGYDAAERVMLRFGNEDDFGYAVDFPIATLVIRPLHERYAEELTHRDYLGALMNLGVERDVLGDILLSGQDAYVFVVERMAAFVTDSLHRVRHTDVSCGLTDGLPEGVGPVLSRKSLVVSSVRLDGIIAKLYHLSRSAAKDAFGRQEVLVNGRVCTNPSVQLSADDVISVRHRGKCIYRGISHETRKGNEVVDLDIFE